jgi:hypothetical protein
MPDQDKDVRVKIMNLHSVAYDGGSMSAFLVLVDNQYRATFRYQEDLNNFLEHLKSRITGKIIFEEVYRDP